MSSCAALAEQPQSKAASNLQTKAGDKAAACKPAALKLPVKRLLPHDPTPDPSGVSATSSPQRSC